jgi:spore maturation protein SpmA
MVRKGAWTALESKTKGFVPNRLTAQQITDIPAANLREGMMVYNITSDCLYINTDGTPTGWKCFNTQTCPD